MVEVRKAVRGADLSSLGLTEEDIENRGVVAVGYGRGELLPPYVSQTHEARATDILAYYAEAHHKLTRHLSGAITREELEDVFPEQKVVEVVGLLANFCVPVAIQSITSNSRFAYIESAKIFSFNTKSGKSDYPDFVLGRMVMRQTLWRPERSCQIIGRERFIYY